MTINQNVFDMAGNRVFVHTVKMFESFITRYCKTFSVGERGAHHKGCMLFLYISYDVHVHRGRK